MSRARTWHLRPNQGLQDHDRSAPGTFVQTRDCKTMIDLALRLTFSDKIKRAESGEQILPNKKA
jgi:hypothetical protein